MHYHKVVTRMYLKAHPKLWRHVQDVGSSAPPVPQPHETWTNLHAACSQLSWMGLSPQDRKCGLGAHPAVCGTCAFASCWSPLNTCSLPPGSMARGHQPPTQCHSDPAKNICLLLHRNGVCCWQVLSQLQQCCLRSTCTCEVQHNSPQHRPVPQPNFHAVQPTPRKVCNFTAVADTICWD